MSTLTEEQIKTWLNEDSARRGILVEVGVRPVGYTQDIVRYLSNFGYTTSPADTPSNTEYEAIVNGGIKTTEKLGIKESPSLSVGDLELFNPNGEYDSWLLDTWTNRPINVYYGDISWSRDKFYLVFSGVLAGVDSRSRNSINLQVRDKQQRLNTPISELKYSDIAPYPDSSNNAPIHDPLDPLDTTADIFMPVMLGECINVTPILIDPGNLVYTINYGPIKGVIEVRDNGVPLSEDSYEVNKGKGTVKLLYQPAGIVTISAKGDAVPQSWDPATLSDGYRNTAGSIIRRLVTGYGKTKVDLTTGQPTTTPSEDRFSDSDIDVPNFQAFELSHPQPIGIYSTSRDNLLTICQNIASSVGAQLYMSRLGKLSLITMDYPPTGMARVIDGSSMSEKTLQVSNRTDIKGSVKIGFSKNWTVQNSLATNLPYEHKVLFAQDYSTTVQSDADVIVNNKLTAYPEQEDTYLITQEDAYIEANRRLNLFKTVRTVYKFTGTADLLDLKLGEIVALVNPRFNLTSDNNKGYVLSLTPDWVNSKILVEVIV